jgi:hypothetical protein
MIQLVICLERNSCAEVCRVPTSAAIEWTIGRLNDDIVCFVAVPAALCYELHKFIVPQDCSSGLVCRLPSSIVRNVGSVSKCSRVRLERAATADRGRSMSGRDCTATLDWSCFVYLYLRFHKALLKMAVLMADAHQQFQKSLLRVAVSVADARNCAEATRLTKSAFGRFKKLWGSDQAAVFTTAFPSHMWNSE